MNPTILFREPELKKKISTVLVNNVRIGNCKSTCAAVAAIGRRFSTDPAMLTKSLSPGHIHPSAAYCESVHGEPATFYKANHDEISVCEFSDGSFAVSSDLLLQMPTD